MQPGETVGYGATWTAERPSRIAILGAGYKDGVPRALSSQAGDGPAQVFIGGKRCPIIGRVSMDMMAVDITGLIPHLDRAGHAGRDPGRQHSHRRSRGLGRHDFL